MSVAEPTSVAADSASDTALRNTGPSPTSRSTRKPIKTWVMHWNRRLHMYFGLFLFPWALLYGVTAFLFNHPTAFSDEAVTTYGSDIVAGTALENLPDARAMAAQILDELNARHKPAAPYKLVDPNGAKFVREFAVGAVKTEGQQIRVVVNLITGGGTIRGAPKHSEEQSARAPFALGRGSSSSGGRRPRRDSSGAAAHPDGGPGILLPNPIHERMKSAISLILERTGFPSGEVTVASVPDLTFSVEADGKVWIATYNPMTGSVSGKPADSSSEPLAARRFLLRLHTTHGYPGEINGRWFWALIVDGMAFTMCFWGLSGLVMWWQIKATRKPGLVILLLSTVAATALGCAMHAVMTT